MKRSNSIVVILFMLFVGTGLYAQPRSFGARGLVLDDNAANKAYITTLLGGVGINMLNIAPNPCAILDLNSQTKGFLIPRMVPAEIAALCGGTPPEGMMVYNTLTHTIDLWNGSTWTGQWQTKGNANLSADNVDNLLGSTALSSVKAFNLIVDGLRIMRYETNNRIIGGYSGNTIQPAAANTVIAGGGASLNVNMINAAGTGSAIGGGINNVSNGTSTTIAGGSGNRITDDYSTVGGGQNNRAGNNAGTTADATHATVAGGSNNIASNTRSAVLGGETNTASGTYSTVAGGQSNTASGTASFIGSGDGNAASGAFSGIVGGQTNIANANHTSIGGGLQNTASFNVAAVGGGFSNVASGEASVVAGGWDNTASNSGSTVAGGVTNLASGYRGSILGGEANTASGNYSTVGGGFSNDATGISSYIGGGANNTASNNDVIVGAGLSNTASGLRSAILGGQNNTATGPVAVIGGGNTNTAGGTAAVIGGGWINTTTSDVATVAGGNSNEATNVAATVGGGWDNTASNNSATVAGGISNLASGYRSAILGGEGNTANGDWSTIGGGISNEASGPGTFVGGGNNNTASNNDAVVAGGINNTASGLRSAVGGGEANTASGTYSTVAGGFLNQATGQGTTIGGGPNNTVNGPNSVIGGGAVNYIAAAANLATIAGGNLNVVNFNNGTIAGGLLNTNSGVGSFIGGGFQNQTVNNDAVVAGGNTNIAGFASSIGGGSQNSATGAFNAIPGGQNLTAGNNTFGYNIGTAANVSGQSNIAYFGNVDVLVGNTDNSAQQLRFYENNASATLAGADFASFQAPAVMNATTQYALPNNYGNAGGGVAPYILADVSGAGTPRQLTWISGNSSNWLLTGNSGTNPALNFLGTTDATDFIIKTANTERMRFLGAPAPGSSATPLMTINNPTLNQQGLRINGTNDAILGNTLAGNPGVWDLVVNGDAVVTGQFKMGGSMWFDCVSNPHSIKANQRTLMGTTTNNDYAFITNGVERMTVDSTGKIGIGTFDPVSAVHIRATPPTPTPADTNAAGMQIELPMHHVLTVENMNSNGRGDGIAVIIHNPSSTNPITDGDNNDNRTNYITFYNENATTSNIKGRIEGFSYTNLLQLRDAINNIIGNGDIFNPFNYFSFNPDFFDFDPNFLTFDADFIHFTPPTFPTITSGSICCYGIDWSGFSIDWPDITWPSLSGGSIGSLSFDPPVILNGSPLVNFENPFSLNMSFINGKANALKALPYKDKAADFVMNPVKAAMYTASSFFGGVTYESGSGDYAEWIERLDPNEQIGIGDVVSVVGGKVTKNTANTDHLMVATWKPIVLGNMPDPDREQDFTKVAFLGQVPVKILGGCRKGDYILPSGRNDGFARALSPNRIDAADLDKVLGIAWSDVYDLSPSLAKVAVGLKPTEMINVIQKQQAQIENLEEKVAEIELLKQEMAELKQAVSSATAKVVVDPKPLRKPKFRYKTTSAK